MTWNTNTPPGVVVSRPLRQCRELDTAGPEPIYQIDEIFQRPAEAVETPDDDGVALAGVVHQVHQGGTFQGATGGVLGPDPVAPGGLQGVDLQVGILVAC